jgi:hypothetical protein
VQLVERHVQRNGNLRRRQGFLQNCFNNSSGVVDSQIGDRRGAIRWPEAYVTFGRDLVNPFDGLFRRRALDLHVQGIALLDSVGRHAPRRPFQNRRPGLVARQPRRYIDNLVDLGHEETPLFLGLALLDHQVDELFTLASVLVGNEEMNLGRGRLGTSQISADAADKIRVTFHL